MRLRRVIHFLNIKVGLRLFKIREILYNYRVPTTGCFWGYGMLQRVDYKTNLMIGDQTYPAFELRNILDFIGAHLGAVALRDVCSHIGVGRTELEHCQFVYVWQVQYAMEYLRIQSHDPDIGTQLGLSYSVQSLDILLPHLAQLTTLQACLQFVLNHPQLVGSFTDSLIRLEDDSIAIRWLNTGRMEQQQYGFQFLHSIGSLLGLARQLTGQGVTLKYIHLADAPRDSQFLTQATGAQINFNAAYFEWSIDLAYLGLPVTYSFNHPRHSLSEQAENSLIDTVLTLLRGTFPLVPSVDALAMQLHMSDRSLRRKLSHLGTSYQKLLDQVRCQTAIALILKDSMSIDAIAETMGYSDVSHFRQCFKHWLGHPPGYFSRLNRSE